MVQISSASVLQRFWRHATSNWEWLKVDRAEGTLKLFKGQVNDTVHGQRLDMSAALGKLQHLIGSLEKRKVKRDARAAEWERLQKLEVSLQLLAGDVVIFDR